MIIQAPLQQNTRAGVNIYSWIQLVIEVLTLGVVAIGFADSNLVIDTSLLVFAQAGFAGTCVLGLIFNGNTSSYRNNFDLQMFSFSFLSVASIALLGFAFYYIVNLSSGMDFKIYIVDYGIWSYWVCFFRIFSLMSFIFYMFAFWRNNSWSTSRVPYYPKVQYVMLPQNAMMPATLPEPQVIPPLEQTPKVANLPIYLMP